MLQFRLALGAILAALVFNPGCASQPPPASSASVAPEASGTSAPNPVQTTSRHPLHVALFPYIPDAKGDNLAELTSQLEQRFEKRYKDIDLILTMDAKLDMYDPSTLKSWLRPDPPAVPVFDLVEVDTILLDEVSGFVAPWTKVDTTDWHPAAIAAVTLDRNVLGVPHYLCSHFLFSRDPAIAGAKTIADLTAKLSATKTTPHISARFNGSFNVPSLYLDAWADSNSSVDVSQGLPPAPDASLVGNLGKLVKQCAVGNDIPCLDKKQYDAATAATVFADEKSSAFIGYSEALNTILRKRKDSAGILFESVPLGNNSNPLVFTDAIVRRAGCTDACESAAIAFATFLNSPETMELVLLSRDAGPDATPRYLLPATKSAAAVPALTKDRYYPQFIEATRGAKPYPNHDFFKRKDSFATNLMSEWKK